MKEIIIYPSNHVTIIAGEEEKRLSPSQTANIRRDFKVPEIRPEDRPPTEMTSTRGVLARVTVFGTREHPSKKRNSKKESS